jgi:hypothetical protein
MLYLRLVKGYFKYSLSMPLGHCKKHLALNFCAYNDPVNIR